MATKPKTRKAPAVKARGPKLVKHDARALFRAPFGLQPFALDGNKIAALASRYRWLEADQDYQAAIEPRDRDAGLRHEAQQQRIIAELRTKVPKDYFELRALLRIAIDKIKMGQQCDGAESDMLQNAYNALPGVLRDEKKTAVQKGMKNMREFLNRRNGTAYALASDPEMIGIIGRGDA
jgi:hypothetical protein